LAVEGDDKMASTMSPDMAEKMLTSAEKKSLNGTFAGKRQSESASRKSHAERSLHFMQQR